MKKMNKTIFWILVIVIFLGFMIWSLGFCLGGCTITLPEDVTTTTTITSTSTTTILRWTYVGSPGFSAGGVYDRLSLYVYNDTPYVAYGDVANSNQATVMKYNGSTWENVGSAGFSAGAAFTPSLYVCNDTPYVAYQDHGNSDKVTVMKYGP